MILQISTSHRPATDLGYLLHKNPARLQSFNVSYGKIHVFYPEATEERATAALLLDVDPVGLVRGRKGRPGQARALEHYVNDRPYASSSFMSVAIAEAFGTALGGRSKERQELADTPIPLDVDISVLPCRGGEEVVRRLFEPLGYEVEADRIPLDQQFPDWGDSRYFRVRLSGIKRLAELLSHLYVLIPVLDDEKHYWVGTDEVEKLLSKGSGWLAGHPEKQLITDRYLRRKRSLTRAALERLMDEEADPDEQEDAHDQEEELVEKALSLNEQRLGSVLSAIRATGAKRVLDLGCGEGRLLQLLIKERELTAVVGMDVSYRALEVASRRLRLDQLAPAQRERVKLIHGSLIYRDRRLEGFDAAAVVEVIEHLDSARLTAFEKVLFGAAKPSAVILTTPNVEYNVRFSTLPAGMMRHKDHRFEWSRAEFAGWAGAVADRFDYSVRFLPVGPEDPEVGPPTQMAVFTR